MSAGKLPNDRLAALVLNRRGAKRPETVVRGGIGEDSSALRLDGLCVLSCDPITAATLDAGRLAVLVCLNDVAAAGAEPVALMMTLLLPTDAGEDEVARIMADASDEASRQSVEIIGGHTEFTDAVTRPVVCVTMIGQARGRLLSASGAQAGDALIMTKSAGIEGAKVLLSERGAPFLCTEERDALDALEISIRTEAIIAVEHGASAAHDVTEGGVLGAAWEVAEASGLGLRVDADAIPVHSAVRKVCGAYGVDPLKLIGSGSLLIAAADGEGVARAIVEAGVDAAVIGRFENGGERVMVSGGIEMPLDPPGADELYGALGIS